MATLTEENEDMSQCATISAVSVDDVAVNSVSEVCICFSDMSAQPTNILLNCLLIYVSQ